VVVAGASAHPGDGGGDEDTAGQARRRCGGPPARRAAHAGAEPRARPRLHRRRWSRRADPYVRLDRSSVY
jgi:hypothetical protein